MKKLKRILKILFWLVIINILPVCMVVFDGMGPNSNKIGEYVVGVLADCFIVIIILTVLLTVLMIDDF